MLVIRSKFAAGAVLGLAAATTVTLVLVLPASGSPASSERRTIAASIPLTQADINTVNSVGSLLATKPGSVVQVVRSSGTAIWNAVAPGVTTDQTTPDVMGHDFLLVTCTDNPTQSGYKAPRGPIPVIGEVQVVIDEVTGHVLEITRGPKGMADPSANAVSNLGTPTTVTLSAASFG